MTRTLEVDIDALQQLPETDPIGASDIQLCGVTFITCINTCGTTCVRSCVLTL